MSKKPPKSILTRNDESITIRKIENGYLIHTSWTDGKGDYQSKEVFSDKGG